MRKRRLVLFAMASVLVGVYLTRYTLLATAGAWLVDADRITRPVDCAIVLGGDAQTRPFFAAALYNAGWCRRVAYIETVDTPETRDGSLPTHGTLMRAVFSDCRIPVEAITRIPGVVSSTREEYLQIAAHLQSTKPRSCAIVTSDFHTRRCRRLCDRMLGPNSSQVFILGAPTDGFGPQNWWQYRGGVHRYCAEFIKLGRDLFR
jgi:uncharacterized SAM-binding protein YcdF (DUF218 family)